MLPDGTYFQSTGQSKGKIAEEIIGELKKPYFYSVFVLDGQDKPFNALTLDELETSYRYTALKNILIELQEREKKLFNVRWKWSKKGMIIKMEDMELLKAYAEVNKILSFMEDEYINKIPTKLKELFKNERLKGYNPNINPKIPLDEQKLQRKTYSILAMLNLNYWCEDENEKQKLIAMYKENDRKREEELREKYNPDNLFKNRRKNKKSEENLVSTVPIEYEEKNFLKKLLNKILNFFKRKTKNTISMENERTMQIREYLKIKKIYEMDESFKIINEVYQNAIKSDN